MILLAFTLIQIFIKKINWILSMHSENLLEIKNSHQIEILQTKTDAEEAILTHIGRELHDNICQSLVLANLYLQVSVEDNSTESKNKIELASKTILQTVKEIKLLGKEFNSDIAMQMGLIESIKDLIIRVEESNVLKVGFQVVGDPQRLKSDQELGIFRILQESLSNTVSHALASKANIELNYSTELLSVVYQDNGYGYEGNNKTQKKLSGLINVQNRAKMINASYKSNSILNNGSTVFLTLPFQK
jgi:signal transduction histidine kinase